MILKPNSLISNQIYFGCLKCDKLPKYVHLSRVHVTPPANGLWFFKLMAWQYILKQFCENEFFLYYHHNFSVKFNWRKNGNFIFATNTPRNLNFARASASFNFIFHKLHGRDLFKWKSTMFRTFFTKSLLCTPLRIAPHLELVNVAVARKKNDFFLYSRNMNEETFVFVFLTFSSLFEINMFNVQTDLSTHNMTFNI